MTSYEVKTRNKIKIINRKLLEKLLTSVGFEPTNVLNRSRKIE